MALVGIALLGGCADASDDDVGSRAPEPLGVVPPDDVGAEDVPDHAGTPPDDDGAEMDDAEPEPDASPEPDADPEPDASPEPDADPVPQDDDGEPAPAVLAEAALKLFEATEPVCADHAETVGNPPIAAENFAGAEVVEVRPGEPDLVVIRDGLGVELFVVVDRDEIWGGPDPDAVMPHPYSFGCPPDVYVGTLDH